MRSFFTFLFIFASLMLQGQGEWQVSKTKAEAVAKHWLQSLSETGTDNAGLDTLFIRGKVIVVNLTAGRYVLVSGDLRCSPVLGWGGGSFPIDASQLPPAMKYLLDSWNSDMDELSGNADPSILDQWEQLETGASEAESLTSVSPMLSSSWGQGCLYNSLCPLDSAATSYYCYHVPTGCVATALAQIMRYWEYPSSGSGSRSYTHPSYGTLSANFGSTQYLWNSMPLSPGSSASGIPQLMFHLGVSVNMAYGPASSGSYANDARGALVNYFSYDGAAIYRQKISYTDPQWQSMLKNELDSGRPVFYGGLDPNGYGGHAWVVDGYQGQYYHINWGWDGALNGNFLLTALNPQGNANFTNLHEAIMGIKPATNVLKARFIADKTIINPGDSVHFQDVSSGNPQSWNWSFAGTGTPTLSQQNPAVKFTAPGKYAVKLIVSAGGQHDTLDKPAMIRVLPLAGFKASTQRTETGGKVDFTDMTEFASPVTSWQWTFNGGTPSTSTVKNPGGIKYNSAGIFSVSLKVTTVLGQHTLTIPGYIKVYNQCDTMLNCDVDAACQIQPSNAGSFQISMFDLDQRVPYYASIGHTSSWVRFNKVLAPGDTNFFYGATSWFVPPGKADNYLVFGPLSIPIAGAEFEWSHLYWLNHKRDGYEVLVSGSGPQPASFSGPAIASWIDNDPGTEGDTVWMTQSVVIPSAFNGQTIYLAFHHTANDMSYLFLDDFRVASCSGLPGSIAETIHDRSGLLFFPNPASATIRFDIPDNFDRSEMKLFDAVGRLVEERQLSNEGPVTLNLDALRPGVYLVLLNQDGRSISGRFVISEP